MKDEKRENDNKAWKPWEYGETAGSIIKSWILGKTVRVDMPGLVVRFSVMSNTSIIEKEYLFSALKIQIFLQDKCGL